MRPDNELTRAEYQNLISSQKYYAKKTMIHGIRFDSKKEAERYLVLKDLEKQGEIKNLRLQVPFVLIPSQKDENGKTIERPCKYIADFVYTDKDGHKVVEDVKSRATSTPEYRIKRKLMLERYKIRIREV